MENSLSETLITFYPLAGRFIEDRTFVDCNDQGAEYLIAQVEVVAFSPTVLAVQLNMFDCGGLAIGVPLSHKVADGFVIFTFFQAWAAACRFGNTTEVVTCPSFEMGSLLLARDTDKLKIPVPEEYGVTMVTKRFVFDELAISTLKAKAKAIGEVSRVVVMTAVLWKARILVVQAKHGLLWPSLLNISYNLQRKTGVIARFKTSECKLDFNDSAALLGNSIRETAADCLKTEDADDLFTLMISSMTEIHEILEKNETDICVFTSVCGWVNSVHKPSDIVLMMDTECGRGIEAWETLEKKRTC
ncbi:F21J9.8 [Citrus sinensis]|uniref:F21J9.8 n=1 Tax=Citrus sinensis TaxID=2711 RepID=A0ACB8IKM2_CITSI|nr:F21J9.8 [Citrus sinensis]